MEKSTSDLLKLLEGSDSFEEFLDEGGENLIFESLSEYLTVLVKRHKLKKSVIIKKSDLDKNYAYQLFNGNKTNPSRNKILMLSFGMGLSVSEARTLLKVAQCGDLYVKIPRDALIIYCLKSKMTLHEANEKLYEFGLDLLA